MSIFDAEVETLTGEAVVREAREAAQILESPVFQKAHVFAEADILAVWRDAESVEERERCHAAIHALEGIRSALRGIAEAGEVAAARLREVTGEDLPETQ